MDLATDGRVVYASRVSGVVVAVGTRNTKAAPGPLMGERIAASPDGTLAVAARIGSGPLQDRAYACLMGGPWVELGPTSQLQAIAWTGGRFVCARIGPGGAALIEQTLDGTVIRSRPVNTSQGVLYYDERDRDFILTDVRINQGNGIRVGPIALLKAVRRGDWWCGQAVNPDRLVIAKADGSRFFQAGKQPETPAFVVIGDRLICNGPTEFRPPYPADEGTPPPPPPPPPEPPPTPIPNHLRVVQRARDNYAHKSGRERAFLIVNYVAWDRRDEGCGLFFKTGDSSYNERSSDIVIFKGVPGAPAGKGPTFDILGDAEGKATPTWSSTKKASDPETTGYGDLNNWRAPVDPAQFEPGNGPDPEPIDHEALLREVRATLAATIEKIDAALGGQ